MQREIKINATFLFRDVAGPIFLARLFPFSRSRRFSCQIVENSGDSVYGFNLGNHFADHLKQDQNRLIPRQAKRVGSLQILLKEIICTPIYANP